MTIDRYAPIGESRHDEAWMECCSDGEYVKHLDHEQAMAEKNKIISELRETILHYEELNPDL